MKILYAIQGTGNGHITRSATLILALQKLGKVDILLSGNEVELKLQFEVKYQMKGIGFVFGKKGGINYLSSFKKNNFIRFLADINSLPVHEYDIVISDFEPIAAWACKIKNKTCVSLSNQAALLHPLKFRKTNSWNLSWWILKYYAPASYNIGLSFDTFAKDIFHPIIRQSILTLKPSNGNQILVYLPAYNDQFLIDYFKNFPLENWEIFSKRASSQNHHGSIVIKPIAEASFLKSLTECKAVITAAGFGLCSEALYLNKKLLVIPMKGQLEQKLNAQQLNQMGIPSINKLNTSMLEKIEKWLAQENNIVFHYNNPVPEILKTILNIGIKEKTDIPREKVY